MSSAERDVHGCVKEVYHSDCFTSAVSMYGFPGSGQTRTEAGSGGGDEGGDGEGIECEQATATATATATTTSRRPPRRAVLCVSVCACVCVYWQCRYLSCTSLPSTAERTGHSFINLETSLRLCPAQPAQPVDPLFYLPDLTV